MATTPYEEGSNGGPVVEVSVDTKTTASKVERHLAKYFSSARPSRVRITLARNLRGNFFGDTWVAILVGTAARRSSQFDLVDWSNYADSPCSYEEYVCGNLPAAVGVSLGAKFTSFDGKDIALTKERVEDAICDRGLPLLEPPPEDDPFSDLLPPEAVRANRTELGKNDTEIPAVVNMRLRGLLRTARGEASTVCEFDPKHSLSDLFSDEKYPLHSAQEQSLFRSRIIQFRNELEFGAKGKGIKIVNRGSIRGFTDFLMELHENSCDYGRFDKPGGDDDDRPGLPGMRFLRLRKYIGSKKNLVSRASDLPPLKKYLEKVLTGKNSVIIEASVSDFGLGIVDYFLSSSAGKFYRGHSSRELLSLVFRGRVTSKVGDPAAGAGIHKALASVRTMAGFVSLRTADHWLQRGFHLDDGEPGVELSEMLPGESLGRVAGTHWLFLYHQNIDSNPIRPAADD